MLLGNFSECPGIPIPSDWLPPTTSVIGGMMAFTEKHFLVWLPEGGFLFCSIDTGVFQSSGQSLRQSATATPLVTQRSAACLVQLGQVSPLSSTVTVQLSLTVELVTGSMHLLGETR